MYTRRSPVLSLPLQQGFPALFVLGISQLRIVFSLIVHQSDWQLTFQPGNTRGGKYRRTVDLLFD
jgi:hypothetical protein